MMTSPILPIVPTAYRPSAPTRAPVVTAPDDAQSPGPGVPSDGPGTDAFEKVTHGEPEVKPLGEPAANTERSPVGDYLIAAEAHQAAEVTVVDRDRAIAAFTDIMRMQI